MIGARTLRAHLAVTLAVTCVTAWFSYGYFHIDEYFQVLELVRWKLGAIDGPLPWETLAHLRPWLQPMIYWALARALGLRDVYEIAFVARLMTGLANIGALALFLKTTLPWFAEGEERRLHLRVVTLAGFLPYLFVRTSSESASTAALTAAFALLFAGAREEADRTWRIADDPRRDVVGGLLLGLAFELRYQTAFLALGVVAWLVAHRARRKVLLAGAGGLAALGVGALADRWGYGHWELPSVRYFVTNVLEGAAGTFGTDPPFAYLWLTPANVFFPVVASLVVLAFVAWMRSPRHPITAATLPFFVVHGLIGHKEERFLFPLAILALALPTIALRSSPRLWALRDGVLAKGIAASSCAAMAFLAFYPLAWGAHVRFDRWTHDHLGAEELHATALPEINLGRPPFRPRVWDVDKADAAEILRRVAAHEARPWLIAPDPELPTELEGHATLVYTERPPWIPASLAVAYNARAPSFLPRVHYRTLYRVESE